MPLMRKALNTLLVIAVLVMATYGLRVYLKEPLYHTQSYVFGTLVDISIYGETDARARQLADHVLQDFQQLHHQLHAWKSSPSQPSELSALNLAFSQGSKPISISQPLTDMLHDATQLSLKSQGLFNPAIGHLIGTWGFQRDEFSTIAIDDTKIQVLVKSHPQMSDIVIEHGTAYSKNSAVKLDLGGYAKGYALDMAVRYLRQQQVKNALVNIGGNIIAIGQHGKQPWRVGIQHPRKPSAIATLDLDDGWAIGTSGDYQRYFMLDGKRYCHVLDPRTGHPVEHTQAVTVLIPPQGAGQPQAGVLSDVASKPIFIAPFKDKTHMASLLGVQYFMVIDQQSHATLTKAFAQKLHWLDDDFKTSQQI